MPAELIDLANDSVLLWALGGLLTGGLIAWLWRGADIGRLKSETRAQAERLHELDIEQAGLLSERDLIGRQLAHLEERVRSLQQERDALVTEHAKLNERQSADQKRFEEQRAQLKAEFENLANRIFEERGKQFSSQSQQSMEALLKPFGEQIKQFQSRVNEVHTQSVQGNASLAAELRQLMGVGMKMSDQAENLAKALKGDKKTTGNWGEVQLERTLQLAGLERGEHYEAQAGFRDEGGRLKMPDFVIKLPDGKHLVIDCKVSLVDYDRAIAADTEEEREEALKAHAQALKRHIDDLAGKDYTALGGLDSPELVFMFMPIEAAYIEALKYNRELFNDGYRKKVVMVSHTTLLPMLRTVAGLWIAYRSNQEARAISEMAGDIYNKVVLVGQRLEDMGKTLNTVTDKYNRTVTAVVGKQGLYGKVERFRSTAANAKGELPKPETKHPTIDHDRLGVLREEPGSDDGGKEQAADNATPRLTAVDSEKKPAS